MSPARHVMEHDGTWLHAMCMGTMRVPDALLVERRHPHVMTWGTVRVPDTLLGERCHPHDTSGGTVARGYVPCAWASCGFRTLPLMRDVTRMT